MPLPVANRYLVNRGEKQYVDNYEAYKFFEGAEDEEDYEGLVESWDEFVSDQWGHDEVGQFRELEKSTSDAYENVTEHFVKRRFGTIDFSDPALFK